MAKPRPTLDRLEELVATHRGDCPEPCEACELVPEVQALLRLLRMMSDALEAESERKP